jgi:hypothetical protein
VLEAAAAKQLADTLLARVWSMRDRLVVRLMPSLLDVSPGDRVRPNGVGGEWVVDQLSIEGLVVVATLRSTGRSASARPADSGRPITQPDVVALPTVLALFDLTDLGEEAPGAPSLQLAAASASGGYRAVPIRVEINGAVSTGQTAASEALLGTANNALAAGQGLVLDTEASIEVVLANPARWLQSCDDAALAGGANMAAIGDELIQFGNADPVADGVFRLSRLLRGRRGSEWAMDQHVAGEPFLLLDARTIKPIAATAATMGTLIVATAYGPANGSAPPSVNRVVQGEAVRPLSPAQLAGRNTTDGSLEISWVRRSRRGWAWIDEVDVPPDPDLTGYRIAVSGAAGELEFSLPETQLRISAAELVALGSGPLTIAARQVGSFGLSRPATLTLNP